MELKEIQEKNRIILNEIDRVCNKYGITYYLDSGALLGAIRHKSFIPWDDDLDIAFSRKEYCKFREIVKKEWSDGEYRLYEPADIGEEMWIDWTNHVIHTTDEWKKGINNDEYAKVIAEDHPYIDIFIIDSLPDNPIKQRSLFLKLILDYGLAMGHRPKIRYDAYNGVQKVVVWILAHIGKHLSMKKIIERYNKHCTMYQNDCTNESFFSNYSFPNGFRKVYQKAWFLNGSKVQLDGVSYNAPKNPHEYLSLTYGDYMKLPPEAERMPKHWQ
ncbi:MAG: phosphorylcholine transferase LicD [Lachnospiraceae bacterium]